MSFDIIVTRTFRKKRKTKPIDWKKIQPGKFVFAATLQTEQNQNHS